jgi:hypothetical protein
MSKKVVMIYRTVFPAWMRKTTKKNVNGHDWRTGVGSNRAVPIEEQERVLQ